MSVERVGQSEMGYLLQALTEHLLKVVPEKCHKTFDSWMDTAELRLEPRDEGFGQQLGLMDYEAVLSLSEFPFRESDPAVVLASVMAWLQDNDPFREKYELDDPTFEVEPESENVANVEINIHFIEPVTVVEDEKGQIDWQGKKYSISSYEVWIAEKETKLDFDYQ